MANTPRNARSAPSDAGDPGQRDETKADAPAPDQNATPVDAEALIQETKDAAKIDEYSPDPQSEADFGGSGQKKTLKTDGPYMIVDPTTGVEVTQEAREVEMSAFLQGKIDDGLVIEG